MLLSGVDDGVGGCWHAGSKEASQVRFILRLLITGAVILAVAYFGRGTLVTVTDYWWAVLAALVLTVVNVLVKPIASLLALPVTILTLGLFSLVVNGLMLSLVSWLMRPNFAVAGFWQAVVAALLISVMSTLITRMLVEDKGEC